MTGQRIQQEAICYQWFKQRLILSVSKFSISQPSQIKEDTVEPSVPAREFNLKAYATITWQWSGQPVPWTPTHRSPYPGSVYHDATNSATWAGYPTWLKSSKSNATSTLVIFVVVGLWSVCGRLHESMMPLLSFSPLNVFNPSKLYRARKHLESGLLHTWALKYLFLTVNAVKALLLRCSLNCL